MSKASQKAYDEVRRRILSGDFPEGSHLKEEELADICGVSRTPIRDALRKLAADYYVRIVPNHGTFVSRWSGEEISDIFVLRAMLEGYAARLAARRAKNQELAEMQSACEQIDVLLGKPNTFDKEGFFAANKRYHMALRAAAGSDRLASTLTRLVEQPVVMRTVISYAMEDFIRSNAHHWEILEALREGDGAWAEAAMRGHIHAAYHVYRRAYGLRDHSEQAAKDILTL